jgi:hypothetical protein
MGMKIFLKQTYIHVTISSFGLNEILKRVKLRPSCLVGKVPQDFFFPSHYEDPSRDKYNQPSAISHS